MRAMIIFYDVPYIMEKHAQKEKLFSGFLVYEAPPFSR
jgi:hypothetical protein